MLFFLMFFPEKNSLFRFPGFFFFIAFLSIFIFSFLFYFLFFTCVYFHFPLFFEKKVLCIQAGQS